MHELSSLSSRREKPCREIEDETISFLFERQEEHILADFRAEIQKHEFQADSEDLREAHMKSLDEMELKRFQGSTFDESLNSRPEFRNYRMKVIVCMIRKILKMLNQYAVDYPTFPVNQRYSHLVEILAEC